MAETSSLHRKLRSTLVVALASLLAGTGAAQSEYLAGYLIIPTGERVEPQYNAGFSMYVAAWPLLRTYPGHQFQTGLPGTWMFAQFEGTPPKDMYSDVEGGLGWWRDTRFPTESPKFIMGGVGPNFSVIANGPAHGWGTWEKPRGLYGVAQLSPWLLFPIDGLNVAQDACGELFGYGYLKLPLTEPKKTTSGKPVPTGNHCWTLFLNTQNFKGPVAFFLPNFWSQESLGKPEWAGKLLDSRPVDPNRHVQMETQYIPCRIAVDSKGDSYARIAPTAFPRSANGNSILVHHDTVYSDDALWNSVSRWFEGGKPSTGEINAKASFIRTFPGRGSATWEFHTPGPDGKEVKVPIDWNAFATPLSVNGTTFGYSWNYDHVTKTDSPNGPLATLPEYFRLDKGTGSQKPIWKPVKSGDVPAETNLHAIKWETPKEDPQEPYTTPDASASSWKTPGPKAGPFKAKLGDGSVVTYYWYRFADQPALLNADLTKAEREAMQKKVEKLHRTWTKNRNYLPPPTVGKLANLDPAQIVKPPKGLEVGYVPIATRQELGVR